MSEIVLPAPPSLTPGQSVLLDFDGTLVDIAPTPHAVHVDAPLKVLLRHLHARHAGRVAIVSGRSIDQLTDFLGESIEAFTLIGSHGAELRTARGERIMPSRPPALTEAARAFSEAFADRAGVLIEDKSLGVAVHFRLEPSAEIEVRSRVTAFAAGNDLAVQEGRMMVELRLRGHDKGTAIAALLTHPPFCGHPAIFVGDDLTDEPGFTICEKSGGAGILVGAPRPTAARYRLDDVTRVRHWLAGVTA